MEQPGDVTRTLSGLLVGACSLLNAEKGLLVLDDPIQECWTRGHADGVMSVPREQVRFID